MPQIVSPPIVLLFVAWMRALTVDIAPASIGSGIDGAYDKRATGFRVWWNDGDNGVLFAFKPLGRSIVAAPYKAQNALNKS